MFLGAHESIAGGIYKSIDRAMDDNCESMQIFVKNANRWKRKKLSDKEITLFVENLPKLGKENVCAHSSYLINMASSNNDVRNKSFLAMEDELDRCDILNIPYFVVHPGAHVGAGESAGLKNIINMIDDLYNKHRFQCMILLETTAGTGTNLGYDLNQLAYIMNNSSHSEKLGICLDSCHMYAAGYDLKNNYEKVISETFDLFDNKIKVIHLNDSKYDFGTKKDRHEFIGKGYLGEKFFETVINDPRFKNILGILETPADENYTYKKQIAYLKRLRR